jgi:gamma-glutamylcyclotransferase (GGCT)/AIG2-like uncharacterized protein YtfP
MNAIRKARAQSARGRTSLFVYGTLQDSTLVTALTGRRLRRRSATLDGYRKVLAPGSYPYVVLDPEGTVDGFVLLDVDEATLRRLDRYEDEGRLYRRTEVIVRVSGRHERAMTYVGIPAALTSV